jgi:hypothetical protein
MELQDARRYRELEKDNIELKKMPDDSLLKGNGVFWPICQ